MCVPRWRREVSREGGREGEREGGREVSWEGGREGEREEEEKHTLGETKGMVERNGQSTRSNL